jgi:hypothetical protein
MKKVSLLFFVIIIVFSKNIVLADTQSEYINEDYLKECVILKIGSCNALVNDINMVIDQADEKITPFIENSNAVIPLRFVTQALDMRVDWIDETREITVSRDAFEIKLAVDSNLAVVNGVNELLPEPVVIKNNRSFIPLRFICEKSGKTVMYFNGTIIIGNQQLDNEQIQFVLSQKDFNREEILTVRDKAGELKALKFLYGKSVIAEADKYILFDKNMNDIHEFIECDELIWENNDGMIWTVSHPNKGIAEAREKNPNAIIESYPFNTVYNLYDNNGNNRYTQRVSESHQLMKLILIIFKILAIIDL